MTIENTRTPNLNPTLVKKFSTVLNLPFLPDHNINLLREALELRTKGTDAYSGWEIPDNLDFEKKEYISPIDILDYIYSTLHSESFRNRYADFLKTDYPKVPWPKNHNVFWKLVDLGAELRALHLMKNPSLGKSSVTYPVGGTNIIDRKLTKTSPGWVSDQNNVNIGKIFINDLQFFDNVPKNAWEFYIGGYQPAQKWLKDRKGRELKKEDVQHYRKIVKALIETQHIMSKIDSCLIIKEQ